MTSELERFTLSFRGLSDEDDEEDQGVAGDEGVGEESGELEDDDDEFEEEEDEY